MGVRSHNLVLFSLILLSVLALSTYSVTQTFALDVDPTVTAIASGSNPPINPPFGLAGASLKVTCAQDGAFPGTPSSSTCPVIQRHGISYWAYSYVDNRGSLHIVAYSGSTAIQQYDLVGARYIHTITVNSGLLPLAIAVTVGSTSKANA